MNVAYISDSFPPIIDGVSRCVVGYAKAFTECNFGNCVVVTPQIPNSNDWDYDFPVFRFPSLKVPKMEYRFGYPFVPALAKKFKELNIEIMHVHSPFIAMTIARQLRGRLKIPIVLTQHTKWEFDIARAVSAKALQKGVERYVYNNLGAADELWAVSRGAGEYLTDRGYKGSYVVIPNGTDFSQNAAEPALLSQINRQFNLPDGVPVLLFVGRMMWYKNVRLIIEALEILRKRSFDLRMIFVGDGKDLQDMKKMASAKGLDGIAFFAGRVTDRDLLRAYYTRSDLFVFPSVYDTAGLVVLEAAACYSPSVVVRGSAASEILEDGVNGFFSDETAESVADVIQSALSCPERLEKISKNAFEQVYMPWDKVVKRSVERYEVVIEEYSKKHRRAKRR